MRKMKFYTYEEIHGILSMLEAKASKKEIADKFDRTPIAITAIESNFAVFKQNPKANYISGAMRSFFTSYLSDKEPVESQVLAGAEDRISESLANGSADNKQDAKLDQLVIAMDNLKIAVVDFVESEVKRGVEEHLTELDELQQYKIKTEKELKDLREFKEAAKESNFASMLRKKFR